MTQFTSHGVTFYEHPTLGDGHPLLVKKGDEYYMTNLFDAPASKEEALDEYESDRFKANANLQEFQKSTSSKMIGSPGAPSGSPSRPPAK